MNNGEILPRSWLHCSRPPPCAPHLGGRQTQWAAWIIHWGVETGHITYLCICVKRPHCSSINLMTHLLTQIHMLHVIKLSGLHKGKLTNQWYWVRGALAFGCYSIWGVWCNAEGLEWLPRLWWVWRGARFTLANVTLLTLDPPAAGCY